MTVDGQEAGARAVQLVVAVVGWPGSGTSAANLATPYPESMSLLRYHVFSEFGLTVAPAFR